MLGMLLFRRGDFLKHAAALALFAVSGVMHGYAYGEAIVGAETTPLLAYLSGFTVMQFVIALGGYALAHYLTTQKPAVAFLKTAGGALTATGAGFLLFSFAAQ
jgi:urease accessory protein